MADKANQLRVFISYSSMDEEVANSIAVMLESLAIEFFLDKKEIDWGQPIESRIAQGIGTCSHLIVIVSPASVKSEWVPYEVGQARALDKPILPFLTHRGMDLPAFLGHLHYSCDLVEVRTFFEKLVPPVVQLAGPRVRQQARMLAEESPAEEPGAHEIDQATVILSRSALHVRELVSSAKTRIDLLVVHANHIAGEDFAGAIASALTKSEDLRLRILSLDLESAYAATRAKQLGALTVEYRENGRSALRKVASLFRGFGDQARIRVYDDMPMLTLYRIDDVLIVSPETYRYRSRNRCHFRLPMGAGDASEEFMFHYEALWGRSVLLKT